MLKYLVILLTLITFSYSRIIFYENQKFSIPKDTSSMISMYRIGMFAKRSILSLPPATGDSYIQFDLTLTASDYSPFTILFMQTKYLENAFNMTNSQFHCMADGTLRQRPNPGYNRIYKEIVLQPNQPYSFTDHMEILESDLYSMFMLKCAHNSSVDININGQVTIMNPYGHLPGQHFGILPFLGILACLYFIVGVVWIYKFIKYRKELLSLQIFISGVLGLCLAELCILYFDQLYDNVVGYRSPILTALGIIATLARKTVSRVLVLIVCMGFGSVKPTLEYKLKLQVAVYAVLYYVTSCIYEIGRVLYYANVISMSAMGFVAAPVSLVDAGFYVWIFFSLTETMKKLTDTKQEAKLALYRKFLYNLVFYVILSVIWMGFQSFYDISGLFYSMWYVAWSFDAFWHFVFFCIFVAVMVLWAPSEHNKRYAYSEQVAAEDLDTSDSDDSSELELEERTPPEEIDTVSDEKTKQQTTEEQQESIQ